MCLKQKWPGPNHSLEGLQCRLWLTLWSSRCLGLQTVRRVLCWCWGAACRTSSLMCCWPRERWDPEKHCHPPDHHVVHFSSFWSLVLYFILLKFITCNHILTFVHASLLLENGFTPLSGEFSKTAWYSCFPILLKASLASATLTITVGPFMCHEHCPFCTLSVN